MIHHERLAKARKAARYSQRAASQAIGCMPMAYRHWEQPECKYYDLAKLTAACRLFGVSLDWVVGLSFTRHSPLGYTQEVTETRCWGLSESAQQCVLPPGHDGPCAQSSLDMAQDHAKQYEPVIQSSLARDHANGRHDTAMVRRCPLCDLMMI